MKTIAEKLGTNTVHLWTVSLDVSESSVLSLRQLLSTDEVEKSDRFYFERDRIHYTVCRGVLRKLLSCYLNIPACELVFSYGTHGKPYLINVGDQLNQIHFNVSHSAGLAIIGFTMGQHIGVDVEHIRPNVDTMSIAERFFSAFEFTQLKMLPKELQQEAFFACWTRKEAFIKARGDGLSLPLENFDVSVDPREQPQLLAVRSVPEQISKWYMHQMQPKPNYISSTAVKGSISEVLAYSWSL